MSLESPHPESAEPRLHRFADQATGILLIAMVIFSPWAFGGWPKWSIWTMNIGGYALGLLHFIRLIIRRRTGFRPFRWGGRQPAFIRYGLGTITILLLAWCLVSAVNARAMVDLDKLILVEKTHWIDWLPHSYDQPSTWFAFWQYLGLAGVFWALRDWVSIATPRERLLWAGRGVPLNPSAQSESSDSPESSAHYSWLAHHLPERLNRFLWVLCVNGATVALVGIISTFANPTKVLWLLPYPEAGDGGFCGPFWYRHNAAQFANLLWPVGLGLWLSYREHCSAGRKLRVGQSPSSLLPLCVSLLIACPFVILSRGGSITAMAMMLVALPTAVLTVGLRMATTVVVATALLGAVGIGLWIGGSALVQRFATVTFPTDINSVLREFTVRAKVRVPSEWDRWSSTFAGLSSSRTFLWDSPGAVTLSLKQPAVFEARYFVDGLRGGISLVATNAVLADKGRAVEIVFSHSARTTDLYVNGEPVQLYSNQLGGRFAAPSGVSAAYLWVGRGAGGSMIFKGLIDTVTLLDYAVSPLTVRDLAERKPEAPVGFRLKSKSDSWSGLNPGPRIEVYPSPFSPSQWFASGLSGRIQMYAMVKYMAAGFPPLWGAGPGTFASLFQFQAHKDGWKEELRWSEPTLAYVHNDYLQTRLTFGVGGCALIAVGLGLCVSTPLRSRGQFPRECGIRRLGLVALAGCLLHARFDWPLHNHAVLFCVILLCGILATPHSGASGAMAGRS